MLSFLGLRTHPFELGGHGSLTIFAAIFRQSFGGHRAASHRRFFGVFDKLWLPGLTNELLVGGLRR